MENRYIHQPELPVIPNNEKYLLDVVRNKNVEPENQRVDHLYISNYWKQGEHLWKGKLPKNVLLFDDNNEIINDIDVFFRNEKYTATIDDTYVWNDCIDHELENLIKLCWLTNEYVTNGFDNPVGAHWNPRLQANVIHPGGCRNKVIKLFHEGPVDVIYFNTGGFYVAWMKDLEYQDLSELLDTGWVCGCVPDHGSLIPHPMLEQSVFDIGPNIETWFYRISKKLNDSTFKIYFNRLLNSDFDYFKKFVTKDIQESKISVQFKKTIPETIDVYKSIILSLAEVDYENEAFKVTQIK